MPSYFDSSVLLSLIIGDDHADRALDLWQTELERVSSVLLDIECTTVLRGMPPASWRGAEQTVAEQRLDLALEEITLKPLDEDVAKVLRTTPKLSGCRTLDAAHLATALYFRAAADNDLRLCTFDASAWPRSRLVWGLQ